MPKRTANIPRYGKAGLPMVSLRSKSPFKVQVWFYLTPDDASKVEAVATRAGLKLGKWCSRVVERALSRSNAACPKDTARQSRSSAVFMLLTGDQAREVNNRAKAAGIKRSAWCRRVILAAVRRGRRR